MHEDEKIELLIQEGIKYYNNKNYELALDKFEEAKKLDIEDAFIHLYSFSTGLVYNAMAEKVENTTQKQDYYELAAERFKLLAKNYHNHTDGEFGDINALIGNALYKAGNKEDAFEYLKQTESYKLAAAIEQERGINSNKLQIYNQESSVLVKKTYSSFQNGDTLSPEQLTQVVYQLALGQSNHEQRINNLEQEVEIIKEKLRIAGIDTQVNIISKINYLKANDPELYKYYFYFNESLQNIYLASKVIASKLAVCDAGHMERKEFTAIEKGGCYLVDILGCGLFRPWISAIFVVGHDVADNIFNSSAEKKLKAALENFSNVIKKNYDLNLSVEQTLQQLILFYTCIKKDEILTIRNEEASQDIISFFTKKLLPTRQKFFDYTDKDSDDPVVNLAFKDLTALMTYIQDHAEKMSNSSLPFVAQIADIIKEEVDTYYYNKIKSSQVNSIEYTLEQIENNLLESTKINQKIADGQLSNIPLPLISFNFWSLLSLNFFNVCRFSLKGEQRGIENFCNKEYFKTNTNSTNITDTDLNNCMLLLLHKICKSGNEECIKYFKENNEDIINLAIKDTPQLFVTEKAIDLCITDPVQNREVKENLKLKKSEQFFKECFNKIFPNINIEKLKELEAPEPKDDFSSPRDEEDNVEHGGGSIEYHI